MVGVESTASLMNCDIWGICEISCAAIVVKDRVAFPWSCSPLLKKLAPRTPCFLKRSATVREMVDFPVPASPFSQILYCLFMKAGL